jgi:ABC-type multidrug transport system fused ATPase/permease subunit
MIGSLGQSRSLLSTYLRPHTGRVLLLAVLLFGGIGLQLVNPQIIRRFLDTARSGGSTQALISAALLYIALSLLQRGLSLAADVTARDTGALTTDALRRDLALHLLRLDLSFHKLHTPGELIERVDVDASALANYFSRFTLQVVGNGLLLAGILILLFREDPGVGFGLSLYTLLVFGLLRLLHRPAVGRWAAARQAAAEQFGFIEERISGAEEIRAVSAQAYILHRLHGLLRVYTLKVRAAYLIDTLMNNLTELVFSLGYAVGLALGVSLYTRGEASLGTAYLIVAYIGMLSGPLVNLQEQAQDFQQASAGAGRIQELFAVQPAVPDSANSAVSLPEGALPVAFERVSFRYAENGAGNVLQDVSFQVEQGRVLGVLGRTGSGKSTLTRLLFRLYDPNSGSICLGGTGLRELPLSVLRSRVGLVTQDVQLFAASLRDNLAMFDREIGDDRLRSALAELRLSAWMDTLPAGLDTNLAAGGAGLSAGEAQLLAFARVFLKDPGLVILDEASSRLDPVTEAMLERAIDRLFAGRTAIVIAHRLQTVQRADDLLILEAGRVVEYGPRLALAADPGSRFSRLLQAGLEETLA